MNNTTVNVLRGPQRQLIVRFFEHPSNHLRLEIHLGPEAALLRSPQVLVIGRPYLGTPMEETPLAREEMVQMLAALARAAREGTATVEADGLSGSYQFVEQRAGDIHLDEFMGAGEQFEYQRLAITTLDLCVLEATLQELQAVA